MLAHILLDVADLLVGMLAAEREHGIARLARMARHRDQQRTRALQRHFMAAEFRHQVQREIDRGIDAAAAQHAVVLSHKVVGPPRHLGIERAGLFDHRPVRCRPPSIEQARRGEEDHARAGARDIGALGMPLPEEGDHRGVLRDPLAEIGVGSGDDDDVGPLDIVHRKLRHDLQRAGAGHALAVDRRGLHAKAGLLGLAAEVVPSRPAEWKTSIGPSAVEA